MSARPSALAAINSDHATRRGRAAEQQAAGSAATIAEQKARGARMHTLEIQMAKLEGLLEGLREALTGKRVA